MGLSREAGSALQLPMEAPNAEGRGQKAESATTLNVQTLAAAVGSTLEIRAIKEHLAKGQRMLAGDGMSQVTKTLLDLTQRKNFYAGDLLMSVEILRNVTDTFKRASYIPASDGVQNFFQIVSNLLDEENKEKWEDAQQIYPGSIELMQVIEDFIHIVGMGMMDFQNSYLMTGNVVASIQKLPAASVLTDINFPMKGRKGMVDWARNSEDRVVIPKSIFTPVSSKELDESSVFVLGAVLYKNLDLILPTLRNYTVVNSKIIVVTIRPEPKTTDSFLEIELAHLANGTLNPYCVLWDDAKTLESSVLFSLPFFKVNVLPEGVPETSSVQITSIVYFGEK
ncbi:hypothetical protein H8958_009464 [Nasalis larvatus]